MKRPLKRHDVHDHDEHRHGDHESGDGVERDHHATAADRHDVAHREREEHGGIKWGSAFFGWLAAMGMAVLLTALLSAVGAAIGLGTLSADEAEAQGQQNAETITIVGGVILLVILFIAYYCGGYVAGRMARFDGMKQGMAVWVWAILMAVVIAVSAAVAGSEYNILSQLNGFPRIPIDEGDLQVGGIIAAVLALIVPLIGAILGGLAGMRFHRSVDRTAWGR